MKGQLVVMEGSKRPSPATGMCCALSSCAASAQIFLCQNNAKARGSNHLESHQCRYKCINPQQIQCPVAAAALWCGFISTFVPICLQELKAFLATRHRTCTALDI